MGEYAEIVWHSAARCFFKATVEKDEVPKALSNNSQHSLRKETL